MRTVPLAEAKAKLSGLVSEVVRRDDRVTITKRGRPAAVLMSPDEADALDATIEIMSDPAFYAEVLRSRERLDRGEGRTYTLDDLFAEEVPPRARSTRRPASRNARPAADAVARHEAKGARGSRGARKRSPAR